MENAVIQVIEQCSSESQAGTTSFGAVVAALMKAGVESYFADYRNAITTYYVPTGETHTVALKVPPTQIAQEFDAKALQEAIRGAQRGEVKYYEFQQLSRKAGCVCYFVWISGRHVTYFGRRGEQHIERFPD